MAAVCLQAPASFIASGPQGPTGKPIGGNSRGKTLGFEVRNIKIQKKARGTIIEEKSLKRR